MMHSQKRTIVYLTIFFIFLCPAFTQDNSKGTPVITASSVVDWTQDSFDSTILFDTEEAKTPLPSGKNSVITRINMELPKLIKDQLLSLPVNSSQQLGDLVLDKTLTLEQLTDIMENGRRTPGFFSGSGVTFKMDHTINLQNITTLLIRHHHSYAPEQPVEGIASRAYSGIVIDARGKLTVQGEFITDAAHPCFFPKIWDTNMNLIYERNMMNSKKAKEEGIVIYDYSDNEKQYTARIGTDPMHIIAHKVYGQNRTDPVISRDDALRILTVPENLTLLEEGKIVILLDKDQLVYKVPLPEKNDSYYAAYNTAKQFLYTDKVPDLTLNDTYKGILIQADLKFIADLPELLPTEKDRMAKIAQLLKEITKNNDFTILIEGHTADVGKPVGQLNLSIQRAQTIINTLVANGIPRSLFTYRGYGGTEPVASNKTAEGRAENRRVDITVRPKATYIQRY